MIALLLALILHTGTAPAVPIASPVPRALWVWDTRAIRNDEAAQSSFFTFLNAPHEQADKAIGTLFFDGLSVEDFASMETTRALRALLRRAHGQKKRVEFLCGDASWAEAAHHEEALAYLRAVLAFNKAGRAAERFDGLQYDVEPYLLKAWPAPPLRSDYLTLLDKAAALARSGGKAFVVGAAIPRFFSDDGMDKLDVEVLKRLDYVALMDYVDNADALVKGAARIMARAQTLHKRVWIGVETQALKDEPTATFFAVGTARMEQALNAACKAYQGNPAFAGLAIHHWDSYRVFKP